MEKGQPGRRKMCQRLDHQHHPSPSWSPAPWPSKLPAPLLSLPAGCSPILDPESIRGCRMGGAAQAHTWSQQQALLSKESGVACLHLGLAQLPELTQELSRHLQPEVRQLLSQV